MVNLYNNVSNQKSWTFPAPVTPEGHSQNAGFEDHWEPEIRQEAIIQTN